jgi:hypothetical protein
MKTGTDSFSIFSKKGEIMTGQRFTEYRMVHITAGWLK